MLYEHLSETCLAARIGEGGLSEETLKRTLDQAGPALERLRVARDDGSLSLLGLPGRTDDLAACAPMVSLLENSNHVVVLGTGGSSLGARAVLSAAGSRAAAPAIQFSENVDPASFRALLADLDFERSGFLVISKSGGTAEPLRTTQTGR